MGELELVWVWCGNCTNKFLFLTPLFAEYCTVTPYLQDLTGLGHIAWCTVRSGCYWIHDYFLFLPFTVVQTLLSHTVRFLHGRSSLILHPYLQFYFIRFKILPFSWLSTRKTAQSTFPLNLLASINSSVCGMKYENIDLKFVTRSVAGYCCVVLLLDLRSVAAVRFSTSGFILRGTYGLRSFVCKSKPDTFQFVCY